jgi:iron complex outermembrane receptor protein
MPTPNLPVSLITLALLQAFSSSAAAQQQPMPAQVPQQTQTPMQAETPMQEVIISATGAAPQKSASVGGFGDVPLIETPASVSVLTLTDMQNLRIRSSTDAMKFDASVSESYNAVGYAEQFSIRGFALDNNTGYRKDGLAISGDTQIPLENKERIEILKGIAGLQSGMASAGGIIDYIVKRPTDNDLRSVTVEASERGTLYGAIDVGGRFDDPRFGYRINGALERLRSYIKGADGERKFISGAFDWQLTPQAQLQLDMDYQDKSQVTAPGFQLLDGKNVPTGVRADTMLNNQAWTRPVETRSSNIGLRFAYQFNTDWSTVISANRHSFKRDDYTAFPFGCSSGASYVETFCANGDFDVYDYRSLGERKAPLAAQALLKGKFATGFLRHQVTFGTSYFERKDERLGNYLYDSSFSDTSNIYTPRSVDPVSAGGAPWPQQRSEQERALFAQDIISLSRDWKVHAGVRYVQVKRSEFGADGGPDIRLEQNFALPNLALVHYLQENVSVYGAVSQGLEHGGIAPFGTTNVDTTLAPSKSKQFELGIKADITRNLQVTAALFEIRRKLEYTDKKRTQAIDDDTFVQDGQARNRGLELSVQGRATPDLTLALSVAALNTNQSDTNVPEFNGKRVPNVAAFKSSLHAAYEVPQMAGLNLNSTWRYSGKKTFNNENSVTVPGYHVIDLGVAYATRIGGQTTILRANVDNALDKFYWRDVTPVLGGYLFPGAPRTFKLSAQIAF